MEEPRVFFRTVLRARPASSLLELLFPSSIILWRITSEPWIKSPGFAERAIPQDFDPAEIRRLSSLITFFEDWRQFSYPSRNLRFSCQNQSKTGKDFVGAVTFPQFSSVCVPKEDVKNAEASLPEYSKDFVMHVGGLVSALDWCPRVHAHSNSHIRSEFIAVAAHPPESACHKIGSPVLGRGMVQVWCVLSLHMKIGMPSQDQKRQKRTSNKKEGATTKSSKLKRPRGRPRKHSIDVKINSSEQQKSRGRRGKTAFSDSQLVEAPACNSQMWNLATPKAMFLRRTLSQCRKCLMEYL